MGMRVWILFSRLHVRMRVNPEHTEFVSELIEQVGERRQRNQAVSA
ncbi:hypothetical protein CNR480_00472 [Klebsiella pneumoniae]|nr:hypothetical protein CNR480_00472 [Klebsiella pneumoniae]